MIDPIAITAPMSGNDLLAWRHRLGLNIPQAAILLGRVVRTIRYYEANKRTISRETAIACRAYEHWPELRARIPHLLQEIEVK